MIFERISSAVERKAADVSALTWTELFPQMNAKSGVSVNVDSALRVSTVFACARVLAEGIAQLPKNLYDIDPIKNTKTKNTTHPAAHLLSCEPNEFMSSFELFETMMLHAVLTGNAYAYLGWSGNKIVEILPLVPHQVQLLRHADWTLTYNVSDLEGVVTTLSAENVLHLRGPSWNSYLGLDSVQIAREAIGLAIATEETHASLHANGAQPGGVLSVKGKLDKDARERLKTAWNAFQGGVANRFKTAVLDVDAEWKPLSMSGVDSQHLETRRFQIEEICRAMRVFPQLVMHSDKTSTFASADAFFLAHVTHSLMPWVIRWEQAINRTILGDNDNLVCKFNLAALLRGDAASRADFYMKALGGARGETAYMTRNEVRELEDMNPIDGGDKLLLPPPPAPPTVAPPGAGGDTAKALELLGAVLGKFNPNHGPDGRFDGPGGNGRVRQAFRAAGGVAVIAAKAILSHLIASGAAHALIRYGLTTFGAGAIAAIAADLAISAIIDHVSKASLEDVINGLSDEDAKRLASGLVESLDDDELQELSAAVTGSKMNPNHDAAGRFASGAEHSPTFSKNKNANAEEGRKVAESLGHDAVVYSNPKNPGAAYFFQGRIHINAGNKFWRDPVGIMKEQYATGHLSSDAPSHVIYHEIGHALYDPPDNFSNNTAERAVATEQVSKYAARNPKEFVSEVHAAMHSGKTFSPEVMQIFNRYARTRKSARVELTGIDFGIDEEAI